MRGHKSLTNWHTTKDEYNPVKGDYTMVTEEVLLALRGYVPVLYPLLFIGILWLTNRKIKRPLLRLGAVVGSCAVAATIMILLCLCCNITFGVDNPLYKDSAYSIIACSAIAVLYVAHTQSDRKKPGDVFKWIFTILGTGIFVAAFKPLCQMAWFIHKLHM